MTKSKLFAQLRFLPSDELRKVVNTVVSENRNLPLKTAKYKKYLRPNEVIKIKHFFGIEDDVIKA